MFEAFSDPFSSGCSFLAKCFFFFFPFFKLPVLCKHEKAVLLSIQLRAPVHSLYKVFSPKSEFHPAETENIISGIVYVADQLVEKRFVEKEGNGYVLSPKGRRYIKRNIEFYEGADLINTYHLNDPGLERGGR